MINAVVVGYGNIGQFAVQAVNSAPDFKLMGVIRRQVAQIPLELQHVKVTSSIEDCGKVDVALICTPTRSVPQEAEYYLKKGICTVDSYDIHSTIYEHLSQLDKVAKENSCVSVISAGWDPGSDSIVRTLMEVCAPKGITYTNFGPGMSMGHTAAVKSIDGVLGAISMTIPLGTGVHRRMVYVQTADGADFNKVSAAIKSDPYFEHDETHVIKTPDVSALIDRGHGVNMVRKGVSGVTDNQLFEFNMKINNPALTSQIMVGCARAAMKQQPGAYTMIDLPIIDMLYGDRETLIRKLV